jgi:hypothetical protein
MVGEFRYLPRQDGIIDGMVERYSFYVTDFPHRPQPFESFFTFAWRCCKISSP